MAERVLVTGGAGFIGSHIVDHLIQQGDEVLVIDDMSSGTSANLSPEVNLEEMDISSGAFVDMANRFHPVSIAHCAAQASVRASMRDPVMDARANVLGSIRVCQAAVSSGCERIVYLNTGGALYGEAGLKPVNEEHPIAPMSAYGVSKWTAEHYLRVLLPESVRFGVLRLGNVYGPRQDPEGEAGVVSILASRMVRGEPITIFGDGEQTRDFVFVGDVVRAYDLALQTSASFSANISSGVGTTINELFRTLARETGYAADPKFGPERPGDVKHIVLDSSKARQLLGWEPQTGLADGLRQTLAWARARAFPS